MPPRAQLAIGAMTVVMMALIAAASYSNGNTLLAGLMAAVAALRAFLLVRQWRAGQPHRTNNK